MSLAQSLHKVTVHTSRLYAAMSKEYQRVPRKKGNTSSSLNNTKIGSRESLCNGAMLSLLLRSLTPFGPEEPTKKCDLTIVMKVVGKNLCVLYKYLNN